MMLTAPTIYTIEEVVADPIRLYLILELLHGSPRTCWIWRRSQCPGFANGPPFGVTLFAERDTDESLLRMAHRPHRAGATGWVTSHGVDP